MFDLNNLENQNFVVEFLNSRLLNYYPELKSAKIKECKLDLKRFLPEHPKSIVVMVEIVIESNNGLIKKEIVIKGKENEDREKEFELINYFYNHGFNNGNFQVSRPLEYFKKGNLLIYEGRGISLRDVIVQRSSDEVARYCDLAGGWLAKFHSLPAPHFLSTQETILANFLEVSFKKLTNNTTGIDLDRIKKTSNELLFNLPKDDILVHGDFQPEHVLTDDDIILAVDFEKTFRGSSAADLASFLLQLNSVFYYEEIKKYPDRQEVKKWQDSFLAGYQKHATQNWQKINQQIPVFVEFYRLNILLFFLVRNLVDSQNIEDKKEREDFLAQKNQRAVTRAKEVYVI